MSDWTYHSNLPLAAIADAPYWARRHIEDIFPKWGAASLVMNAQLVATELVTNGVRHSGGSMELPEVAITGGRAMPTKSVLPKKGEGAIIRLSLSYEEGRLLIEVWDKSDTPPAAQLPDFVSERGRGLFVVSAFCEKWGWHPSQGGGKVVWAELH
ncbi:ATP-binding protein [Actinomadura hibisca]|uniref:ATP-binding protein n=1 Tax=Actinomadura hibisca TaxID=68565 RepID=UPI0012FB8490|nr:ATP-binding protein [Actinomadura hibisca]